MIQERRGRITEADVEHFLYGLLDLPIVLDEHSTESLAQDIVSLSRAHQLTAYDAAYLELAMRRGMALASLDRQLDAAAGSAGVTLFAAPAT